MFAKECRPARAVMVNNEPEPRQVDGITLLPWRQFLDQLWNGMIV